MVYRVKLSRRSNQHLEAIKIWSYENHRSTSHEFVLGLLNRIRQLRDNPQLGPVFEEPYRRLLYEPYQVFYVIHPRLHQVEVIAIWHSARLPLKLRR